MSEPTVQFGADNPFGDPTGWGKQPATVRTERQRANTLNEVGNEIYSKLFDETTNYEQDFQAASDSPDNSLFDTIGKLVGAAIVTRITITTQADQPVKVSLSGHNHTANPHADTLRKAAHGLIISKGFGAIDFLGATLGLNASLFSSTATIECEHKDELDKNGDHFVGNNYNGMITVEQDYVGVPSSVASSSWDLTKNPEVYTDNQGFKHTRVTAQKARALS